MHRHLYYSQLRKGMENEFQQFVKADTHALHKEWAALGLSNVSVFACDLYVCVYAEVSGGSRVQVWDWPVSFDRYLEKWPTEPDHDVYSSETMHRLAIPMIDVFHDGLSENTDFWSGSRSVEERVGSIARLKPEMASSYIFYHYQKQEESPDSFNSTYMIGSFGRFLFSYHELPSRISTRKRQGLLTTKHSPDNWHEVMLPHFEPWKEAPDEKQFWRKMERLM
ncbi:MULTISPECIES: hypothetical protein [unclassified Paenibacillus]|uniref:hypothetical protein n=1 Tax=unclassified Paenibacillus TaxID=185978 RepID=UPI00278617EF|nr:MULTISPECIES: hypothetical protein [unclassified Paenibacillus]MDQ0897879.1 hypothetical protein [Paenibacillus sp. V4I7]MDQ0916125.1 hypothetical protein [Paenibacillus sp. V4I5]